MADDIKINVGVKSTVKTDMSNVTRDMSSAASSIKNALGTIGVGLGVSSIIGGLKSIIGTMGDIRDAADQLGIGTVAYQKLTVAAEESGVKANQLAVIMQKLGVEVEGIGSNKGAQDAFKNLGFSIEEIIGLNPAEALEKIAQGLAETGNKSAVFELLGSRAGKLIPLLDQMKDGINSLNVSGIFEDEDISKADAFDEKIKSIIRNMKVLAVDAVKGIGRGVVNLMTLDEKTKQLNSGFSSAGASPQSGKISANDALQIGVRAEEEKWKKVREMADKEAAEKERRERELSEYKRKLAKEDAEWVSNIDKQVSDKRNKEAGDDLEKASALMQKEKMSGLEKEKAGKEKAISDISKKETTRQREVDKRREGLEETMRQTAFGVPLFDAAVSPGAWKNEKKDRRDADRKEAREVKAVKVAQDRMDRGVATARDIALLGSMQAMAKNKGARDAILNLDKESKEAAIKTQENTEAMQTDLANIMMRLQAALGA